MLSDRQLWCADTTLTLAIQMAASESGKSEREILNTVVSSPAYEALYDEETELWAAGPAYLLDYIRKCGVVV